MSLGIHEDEVTHKDVSVSPIVHSCPVAIGMVWNGGRGRGGWYVFSYSSSNLSHNIVCKMCGCFTNSAAV